MDELYDLRDHYFEKNGIEKATEKTREVEEKMLEVREHVDKLLGWCISGTNLRKSFL